MNDQSSFTQQCLEHAVGGIDELVEVYREVGVDLADRRDGLMLVAGEAEFAAAFAAERIVGRVSAAKRVDLPFRGGRPLDAESHASLVTAVYVAMAGVALMKAEGYGVDAVKSLEHLSGFLFHGYEPEAQLAIVQRAVDHFRDLAASTEPGVEAWRQAVNEALIAYVCTEHDAKAVESFENLWESVHRAAGPHGE